MPPICAFFTSAAMMTGQMRPETRLRGMWLRWGRLGVLAALLLPVALSAALGLVWLHERGWLLAFLLASAGIYAVMRLGQHLARRPAEAPEAIDGPAPDPEWTAPERAAFEGARITIAQRLHTTPRPWEDMPAEALRVVEEVASALSKGRRGALDFTLPEALLLIDRVALRYREVLRRNLPFSDQLSVNALLWVWRRQGRLRAAWSAGFLVWRGVRLAVNPAAGALREIERVLARPLQAGLNDALVADLQRLLLEEAAMAAVELYSGRLRYHDDELAALAMDEAGANPPPPRDPASPLRIVVVGQTGAGKSTLINALTGEEAAETGLLPTTQAEAGHPLNLAGTEWLLIDTPGLDGTTRTGERLLRLIAGADLVVWVLRANRPARDPDAALAAALSGVLARDPRRSPPPVIRVLAAVDLLFADWPFPEHALPDTARHALGRALAELEPEFPGRGDVVAICAAQGREWNLDALEEAISAARPLAEATRRNRLRTAPRTPLAATGAALGQGLRGLGAVAGRIRGAFRPR